MIHDTIQSMGNCNVSLIARFMGPTSDPSGADRTQMVPMLAQWTLLSGIIPIVITSISGTEAHASKLPITWSRPHQSNDGHYDFLYSLLFTTIIYYQVLTQQPSWSKWESGSQSPVFWFVRNDFARHGVYYQTSYQTSVYPACHMASNYISRVGGIIQDFDVCIIGMVPLLFSVAHVSLV